MKSNRTQLDTMDKQAPAFCGGNWKEETSNMMQGSKQAKGSIQNAVQKAKGSAKKAK